MSAWINDISSLLSQVFEFFKNHVPVDQWPYLTYAALTAAVVGLILSLWGARILRLVYVILFMIAGAACGIHVADRTQVDLLIGLVLGAGLLGLIGHLLYRWWVGITAAVCAMLFVALISGPTVIPTELQYFQDQRLGVSAEEYVLPNASSDSAVQVDMLSQYLSEIYDYFWNQRRKMVVKMGLILGIAGFLGLSIGLVLPRFTTIVGTCLLGVLGLAVGAGILISAYLPGVWAFMIVKSTWFIGAASLYLLGALLFQARSRRLNPMPVQAAPAT